MRVVNRHSEGIFHLYLNILGSFHIIYPLKRNSSDNSVGSALPVLK